MPELRVIDADSHVFEKPPEILEYIPAPFNLDSMGRMSLWPGLDGWSRVVTGIKMGLAHERIDINPQTWQQHLETLEEVDVAVLLPTLGLATGTIKYDDFAVILCRAYNDWMLNTYLAFDPRFKALCLLPMQIPDEASKELERCIKLGMVGGLIAPIGMPLGLGDPTYWAVYKKAQELDCSIVIHGGPHIGLGFDHFRSFAQAHTLGHPFTQMIQATSFLLEGVFDEFPTLRMGFFEAGCAWLPFLSERIDIEFEERLFEADYKTRKLPSEHIAGPRFFATVEHERNLAKIIDCVGDDGLLYAVDFPHEADTLPARKELGEFQDRPDLSDENKRRILTENAMRFYGDRIFPK